MKALAWDDKPEYYFQSLTAHLREDFGILMSTEKDPNKFRQRFREEPWDFVITDVVEERGHLKDDQVGVEIAKEVVKTHPVFVITTRFETEGIDELGLPDEAVVKTKSTPPAFMAQEIHRELDQRGFFLDFNQVLLIDDQSSKESADQVSDFLATECALPTLVRSSEISESIEDLQRLTRRSGAIVALWDAPAASATDWRLPLTLGMASGMPNGTRRLILLQQAKGQEPAALPGVWSDLFTLGYRDSVDEVQVDLARKLGELRIRLVQP